MIQKHARSPEGRLLIFGHIVRSNTQMGRLRVSEHRIFDSGRGGPLPPFTSDPDDLHEYGMDTWYCREGADRDMAERGVPLADFECKHGFLPSSIKATCDCHGPSWHDLLEDLMSQIHLKSRRRRLYSCDNGGCNISTFIQNIKTEDRCPSCGHLGSLLREPVTSAPGDSSPPTAA